MPTTVPTPPRPPSISETVYQTLRRQIVTLGRPPGSYLSLNDICAEFGVSRTPVREAILKLAEEELIVIRPNSATLVTKIRPSRLEMSQFLRQAIECAGIAELGTVRDEDLAGLREILGRQEAELVRDDPDEFYALDDAFHEGLLDLSGRAEAWGMVQRVKAQLDRVRYLAVSNPGRKRRVLEQHRTILTALETSDVAGARTALADHLGDSFRTVSRTVAAFSDYFESEPGGGR